MRHPNVNDGSRKCGCGHRRDEHGADGLGICDDLGCWCEDFHDARRARAAKPAAARGRASDAPSPAELRTLRAMAGAPPVEGRDFFRMRTPSGSSLPERKDANFPATAGEQGVSAPPAGLDAPHGKTQTLASDSDATRTSDATPRAGYLTGLLAFHSRPSPGSVVVDESACGSVRLSPLSATGYGCSLPADGRTCPVDGPGCVGCAHLRPPPAAAPVPAAPSRPPAGSEALVPARLRLLSELVDREAMRVAGEHPSAADRIMLLAGALLDEARELEGKAVLHA